MDQTSSKDSANVYAENWAEMFGLLSEQQQIYAKLFIEQVLTQGRLELLTLDTAPFYQPKSLPQSLNEIRRKVELRKLEHIEMLIEKDAIIKDLEIQKLKLEMLRKKDAIIKELEVNKLKLEIEALSK